MVEETMRIPLLIRGPGFPRGTTCNQPVSNLDIPPTILRMCGIDQEIGMHGRSLVELMREPGDVDRRLSAVLNGPPALRGARWPDP